MPDLLGFNDRQRARFGVNPNTAYGPFTGLLNPARIPAAHKLNANTATGAAFDGAVPPADDLAVAGPVTGYDLWVEGSWSRIDSGDATSDLGLLHIGADYRLTGNLLIGVLGQFDWTDQDDSPLNTQVDGFGWMVGPYVAARLSEQLIFDARAAWGQSDNDVSPFGTYTDSFDTDRWLVRGGLTGDIHVDNWHLTPGVSAIYFEEEQGSYTDSLGVFIPDQTVSLGRLMFGPEAAYLYQPNAFWQVRPKLGLKGVWDFAKTDMVNIATGLAAGSDELRARVEGGVSMTYVNRYTLTGSGFYDGIGAGDFDAFGGRLAINVLIADGFVLTGQSFMTGSGTGAAADYGADLKLNLQLN